MLAGVPRDTWATVATLGLASGASALALTSVAALLGGRLRPVASVFGGHDRGYRVHPWLAIAALGSASVHLLFEAGVASWETAAIVGLPAVWTRFVRQRSYVVLMLLVMPALNRNLLSIRALGDDTTKLVACWTPSGR